MQHFANVPQQRHPLNDKLISHQRSWLAAKKRDDNVGDGLWRIHDDLYDLRPFVAMHPGGRSWLTATMGTDITEAYETHHLHMDRTNAILAQYRVGAAVGQRSVRFTFDESGFYRTLRGRVVKRLEEINYMDKSDATNVNLAEPQSRHFRYIIAFHSQYIVDGLLAATVVLSILATVVPVCIIFAAIALMLLTNSAHNYLHQADNVRMYYFNLSGLSCSEWRISHAMSHHMYTNTLLDMETLMLEPLIVWLPASAAVKSTLMRFAQWLYGPLVYVLFFALTVLGRVVQRALHKQPLVQAVDCIPLALPAAMYATNPAGVSALGVLQVWLAIWMTSSFLFGLIGLNSGHRHPRSVCDGDELRTDMDWGLYQLDALIDREDIRASHFWAVMQFGDHHLHHLFPTLDHGCLAELYPVLERTAGEFGVAVRTESLRALIVGQHWQMVRTAVVKRTD